MSWCFDMWWMQYGSNVCVGMDGVVVGFMMCQQLIFVFFYVFDLGECCGWFFSVEDGERIYGGYFLKFYLDDNFRDWKSKWIVGFVQLVGMIDKFIKFGILDLMKRDYVVVVCVDICFLVFKRQLWSVKCICVIVFYEFLQGLVDI